MKIYTVSNTTNNILEKQPIRAYGDYDMALKVCTTLNKAFATLTEYWDEYNYFEVQEVELQNEIGKNDTSKNLALNIRFNKENYKEFLQVWE